MAFCTNCGKPVADDAAFCTNCGKALNAAQPAPVAEPAPVVEEAPVVETPVAAPAEEAAPVAEAPKAFCTQCGTELNPGATFCTSCGKAVGEAPKAAGFDMSKINVKLLGLIGAGVAVVVGVIILLVCLLGGGKAGSYEEAVEMYMDRMTTCEFSASEIEDAVPEAILDRVEGGAAAISAKISKEMASMKVMMQSMDIDWKIAKAAELPKAALEEMIEDEDLDELNLNVTAGYKLSLEITMSFMGMSETETETYYALEIDGDWYLVDEVFEEALEMAEY